MTTTKYEIGYSTWNGRLLGLLGLGPRHSSLVVGDDEVRVTMGWGFSVTIPRESIVSIETDDERVWGWGVHGWKDTWLVNGTSRGLVRFTIEPPARARTAFIHLDLRVLRVSVADRDAFLASMI